MYLILKSVVYKSSHKRFTFLGCYAMQFDAGLTTLQRNVLSLSSECYIPEDNIAHALNYRPNCMGSQIFHNPKLSLKILR